MREEILSIACDLKEGSMTTNEAKEALLRLFGVSDSNFDERMFDEFDITKCPECGSTDIIMLKIYKCTECGHKWA